MQLVNPLQIFELVRACPDGLSSYQVEKALYLNKNASLYHLRKPGFKQVEDRYVVRTQDPEIFLVLQGYSIPVALKVEEPQIFNTLADQFKWIVEGCRLVSEKADWNSENTISSQSLRSFSLLGSTIVDYVNKVTKDPRYLDDEARPYIMRGVDDL